MENSKLIPNLFKWISIHIWMNSSSIYLITEYNSIVTIKSNIIINNDVKIIIKNEEYITVILMVYFYYEIWKSINYRKLKKIIRGLL